MRPAGNDGEEKGRILNDCLYKCFEQKYRLRP